MEVTEITGMTVGMSNEREKQLFPAYRNGTDEKSWYGNVDVNYSKTFKNNSALTLAVYQNYTHTDGFEHDAGGSVRPLFKAK